ncbi:MAG: ABC transporter ATP-binding protein [Patescibacteria group bacterium]|nr:ABC transporter ATP-binding protein [Patescibacteria group bacterium]
MSLIALKNLSKIYQNEGVATIALHNINLKIGEGEFVAIMGPSGSGKSTLMHIMGFLDRPSEGQYIFGGQSSEGLDDESLAHLRNEKVGFIFQAFNLLPRTTVLENIKLPLIYSKAKDRDDLARVAALKVNLGFRLNNLSNQLSGGEAQRVAIARALVTNPSVIFADEPTGNLDSKNSDQILHLLQKLNQEGRTIIMVTHDPEDAGHAKRLIHLRDGEIESDVKNHQNF